MPSLLSSPGDVQVTLPSLGELVMDILHDEKAVVAS